MRKIRLKRAVAVLLTAGLVVSMSMPAWATGTTDNKTQDSTDNAKTEESGAAAAAAVDKVSVVGTGNNETVGSIEKKTQVSAWK